MNVFADESIDRQIVERLRSAGHLVEYVAEMEPGISDEAVLARANQGSSILLTADKDFGELVFRQRYITHGVILIRLSGLSSNRKAEIVVDNFTQHEGELIQSFTVVTPTTVRIRRQIG